MLHCDMANEKRIDNRYNFDFIKVYFGTRHVSLFLSVFCVIEYACDQINK